MAREDLLGSKETITNFGRNVFICCALIGGTIDGLALRTGMDRSILIGFRSGNGLLSEDRVNAICEELRLDPSLLLIDYGPNTRCKRMLEALLNKAGFITASQLLGEDSRRKTSADEEDTIDHVSIPLPPEPESEVGEMAEPHPEIGTDIVMEEAMTEGTTEAAEATSVKWDDNDLIGTAGAGEQFNLRNRELRAALVGRIRAALTVRGETFIGLNQLPGFNKPSGWWRNVEEGQCRISGTDVESIAEHLGVSVLTLLSGEGMFTQPPAARKKRKASAKAPKSEAPENPAAQPESEASPVAEPDAAAIQAHFRSLVLTKDTRPADGVSAGDLLELAGMEEGVDWIDTYFRLTVAGKHIAAEIRDLKERVAGYGMPIQRMFRDAIAEVLAGK